MQGFDWITPLIGFLGGGGIVAVVSAYMLLRKGSREDKQSADSFIDSRYQRLIDEHKQDAEDLREQTEILRASFTQEAHDLRAKLAEALLKGAVLEERNKTLEKEMARRRPQ